MNETPPSPLVARVAKLGAWLQVAPVLGILAVTFGMIEAFDVLKTSGAGDPVRLSAVIGNVITCFGVASLLALSGLILVTGTITVCAYRSRWMLKFLRSFGALCLVLSLAPFVFGHFEISLYLPFGVFFLIFAKVKKEEFLNAAPEKHKLPSCYKLDDD
ncbi:hypothetical protein [Prosthecobacter sp.]|uniref:hypothetical protein n=1 Tax=Prosthecobacter sp. TaxID=1965333 RepID=UPI003784983A